MASPRILVIDNRDSFTFNVVQALRGCGAATGVVGARDVSADALAAMRIDGLVVSPGPGRPADAGCSEEAIRLIAPRLPVWGICLGHQCLSTARGGRVVRAGQIAHGKTSTVRHDGTGLFDGLAAELEVMRYNSLLVDPVFPGTDLVVSAWTGSGEVMGLRCTRTGAEGVQFHPESVMSAAARPMFDNFVRRCANRAMVHEGAA